MKINSKHIMGLIIIALCVYIWFIPGRSSKNDHNDSVKIDSVQKTITTGSKIISYDTVKPQPTIVKNYFTIPGATKDKYLEALVLELQNKYNSKVDSITILKELLEATKIREYNEVYDDSLFTVKVFSRTKGYLSDQKVDVELKPQSLTYYEKTITKEKYPIFSVFLGSDIQSSIRNINDAVLGVNLGLENQKGFMIEFGYNTDSQFKFGVKKRIFTKFKKK